MRGAAERRAVGIAAHQKMSVGYEIGEEKNENQKWTE
jgi:hypothetical protein